MVLDARTAIRRSLPLIALAVGGLALSGFLPRMRLDTPLADLVSWWTVTASIWGAVIVALILVSAAVLQIAGWRRRGREAAIHMVVLALLLGGAAWANEHLLKPALGVYRPHIVHLHQLDVLGMSPGHFYGSMERQQRRAHLQEILDDPGFDAITLAPAVRDHWIHETGYSLPSGHALTAMCLATYFLILGVRVIGRRWGGFFALLPIWAASVGWSRVLLEVHTPWDVILGGALGGLLGSVAVIVSCYLLTRCRSVQSAGAPSRRAS